MYKNLMAEIARKGITQKEIAGFLGIHENSMSNKLHGGTFTIEEAFKIKARFFPNAELQYLFAEEVEA